MKKNRGHTCRNQQSPKEEKQELNRVLNLTKAVEGRSEKKMTASEEEIEQNVK